MSAGQLAGLRTVGDDRACSHPGLVSIPGSQSVLETLGPILLPVGEPRGGALSPDRRRRTFLPVTNRNELGGNSVCDDAETHPGIGLLHPQKMEQSHAESVAPAYVKERR